MNELYIFKNSEKIEKKIWQINIYGKQLEYFQRMKVTPDVLCFGSAYEGLIISTITTIRYLNPIQHCICVCTTKKSTK